MLLVQVAQILRDDEMKSGNPKSKIAGVVLAEENFRASAQDVILQGLYYVSYT